MKLKIYFTLLCLLILLPLAAHSASDNAFHPPMTKAEQALADIINRSNNDENISAFVLNHPSYDPAKGDYSNMFTPALLRALSSAEREMVKENCDGKYTDEICGFDYDPISCSQGASPGYYYRTEKTGINFAIISTGGRKTITSDSYYKLIKEHNIWKIDGINCSGAKFNIR